MDNEKDHIPPCDDCILEAETENKHVKLCNVIPNSDRSQRKSTASQEEKERNTILDGMVRASLPQEKAFGQTQMA